MIKAVSLFNSLLLIAIVVVIPLLSDRIRRRKNSALFKRGIKICGKVRHVRYEWLGRRHFSRYYELYAEFEYDGKTYYALQKCRRKPPYQPGDPIGVCFDPGDPGENMILDFSDTNVNW